MDVASEALSGAGPRDADLRGRDESSAGFSGAGLRGALRDAPAS